MTDHDRRPPPETGAPERLEPVRAVIPADLETPVSVFLKLEGRGAAFLLESVERGLQMGRYSFVGLDPGAELTLDGDAVTVTRRRNGRVENSTMPIDPADPLAAVRAELARAPLAPSADRPLPPPLGGAVGYLGYDVVRYFDGIDLPTTGGDGLPGFHFLLPRTMVVFDHARSEIEIVTVPEGPDAEARQRARARIAELLDLLAAPLPESARRQGQAAGGTGGGHDPLAGLQAEVPRDEFMRRVAQAQEHILAGDAFQIVLCQRLAGDAKAPPFAVYRALRILNPSPYLFYLDFGDHQLDRLLARDAGAPARQARLQVNPIAGTRPRGETAAADNALAADLLADEQGARRARDAGRPGPQRPGPRLPDGHRCSVDDFMAIERYSHVMHLVSRVSGRAAPGLDMLRRAAGHASRPARSRARRRSAPWRSSPNWRAAGAAPTPAPSATSATAGDMDMCIAIRTMLHAGRPLQRAGRRRHRRRLRSRARVPGDPGQDAARLRAGRADLAEEGLLSHDPADRQLRFVHLQPGAGLRRAGRRGRRCAATTRSPWTRRWRLAPTALVISPGPRHARAMPASAGRVIRRVRRPRPDPGRLPGPPVHRRGLRRPRRPRAPRRCTARPAASTTTAAAHLRRPVEPVRGHALPLADRRRGGPARRAARDQLHVRRRDHGRAPRDPPGRRRAVPPRIDPDDRGQAAAGAISSARARCGRAPACGAVSTTRNASSPTDDVCATRWNGPGRGFWTACRPAALMARSWTARPLRRRSAAFWWRCAQGRDRRRDHRLRRGHARRTPCASHAAAQALVDTCGTGGDGAGTFNISTATAPWSPPAWACRWPSTATAPSPRAAAAPTCWRPWA